MAWKSYQLHTIDPTKLAYPIPAVSNNRWKGADMEWHSIAFVSNHKPSGAKDIAWILLRFLPRAVPEHSEANTRGM